MTIEYNLGDLVCYIDNDGVVREYTITKKTTTIVESSRRFDEPKKVEFAYGVGKTEISQKDIDNFLTFSSKEEAIKVAKTILKNHIDLKQRYLNQLKKSLKEYDK